MPGGQSRPAGTRPRRCGPLEAKRQRPDDERVKDLNSPNLFEVPRNDINIKYNNKYRTCMNWLILRFKVFFGGWEKGGIDSLTLLT